MIEPLKECSCLSYVSVSTYPNLMHCYVCGGLPKKNPKAILHIREYSWYCPAGITDECKKVEQFANDGNMNFNGSAMEVQCVGCGHDFGVHFYDPVKDAPYDPKDFPL